MKSKITGGTVEKLFDATVLNKYNVGFYRCIDTGYIQSDEPFWLEEAYSSAITKLDIGLVSRNIHLSNKTEKIILENFNRTARFLDYAGGYGMFTRIMRDRGFDFYHTDPYCTNLFAEYFSLNDLEDKSRFELTTCFEVAEHLVNPREDFKAITATSDNILFTTELIPEKALRSVDDWWYFIPETGQHISFYTKMALERLAESFGFFFYSDNYSLHLFTKRKISDPFLSKKEPFLIRKARKIVSRFDLKKYGENKTLLHQDWAMIKNEISLDASSRNH